MVVTACTVCVRVCVCVRVRMMNTWTTYRDIDTCNIIQLHKYSDFLVVMISVGRAEASPNDWFLKIVNTTCS